MVDHFRLKTFGIQSAGNQQLLILADGKEQYLPDCYTIVGFVASEFTCEVG